jgi:hypothetical protein
MWHGWERGEIQSVKVIKLKSARLLRWWIELDWSKAIGRARFIKRVVKMGWYNMIWFLSHEMRVEMSSCCALRSAQLSDPFLKTPQISRLTLIPSRPVPVPACAMLNWRLREKERDEQIFVGALSMGENGVCARGLCNQPQAWLVILLLGIFFSVMYIWHFVVIFVITLPTW